PLTVLICESCVVICALSMGLSGSWFLSCVTSSVRNRSWMSAELVAASGPVALLVLLITSWMAVLMAARTLLSDGKRLQRELLGGVHELDAGLERARCRDHVHHLVDDVDVGQRQVARLVGGRMLRVEHALQGRGVLHDRGHPHALGCGPVDRDGGEDDLLRAVGLAGRAHRALGVGEVARNRIQALRLRRHGESCDLEDGIHGFSYWQSGKQVTSCLSQYAPLSHWERGWG